MKTRVPRRVSGRSRFAVSIIIALSCSSATGWGQRIEVGVLSLRDTGSSELLLNRPNRVRITGLMPDDHVSLGTILPGRVDSNVYTFRVDRRIHDTLFVRRRGDTVFTKVFRYRLNPDPVLYLGFVNSANPGHATVDEILAYPRLTGRSDNPLHLFVVRSFEMSVQTKEAYHGPLASDSDSLSPAQLELIKQL